MDRKKEIVDELIRMAKRVDVKVLENDIETFMKDPGFYIYKLFTQNSGEEWYWRQELNWEKQNFDVTKLYKLHDEYLNLKK